MTALFVFLALWFVSAVICGFFIGKSFYRSQMGVLKGRVERLEARQQLADHQRARQHEIHWN